MCLLWSRGDAQLASHERQHASAERTSPSCTCDDERLRPDRLRFVVGCRTSRASARVCALCCSCGADVGVGRRTLMQCRAAPCGAAGLLLDCRLLASDPDLRLVGKPRSSAALRRTARSQAQVGCLASWLAGPVHSSTALETRRTLDTHALTCRRRCSTQQRHSVWLDPPHLLLQPAPRLILRPCSAALTASVPVDPMPPSLFMAMQPLSSTDVTVTLQRRPLGIGIAAV